jgi:predicted ATPase
MNIIILKRGAKTPESGVNTTYLTIDRWDDYSFVTMFYLEVYDFHGELHQIGNVKIGFKGQTTDDPTYTKIEPIFHQLPITFFSLGQDSNYYNRISNLPNELKNNLLAALRDLVYNPDLIEFARGESVFRTSLLRDVSLSVIKGQFTRILNGLPPLTNFEFKFVKSKLSDVTDIDLSFNVEVESKPSTNIHAIIGRNGVGKTTLLNSMIEAITQREQSLSKFIDIEKGKGVHVGPDYFSSLVSVSFSAFDPFIPPIEQPNPSNGTCYFYIGLKKSDQAHKGLGDIQNDFIHALKSCFNMSSKKARWLKSISMLESDENFERMELKKIADLNGTELTNKALYIIQRMSSGHAVVLLTITRLVATVDEKTLVLIDEPESHLHPPLLSAFIRALSELLHDRNGVSIIATHSPVVLQEIPKSCVWKINRIGSVTDIQRPSIETFGENVGILTREVFGLEVVKSGYHDLLIKSVESGLTFNQIMNIYNNQLGLEARSLLKSLVIHRDRENHEC